jgi:hypothetical protein
MANREREESVGNEEEYEVEEERVLFRSVDNVRRVLIRAKKSQLLHHLEALA